MTTRSSTNSTASGGAGMRGVSFGLTAAPRGTRVSGTTRVDEVARDQITDVLGHEPTTRELRSLVGAPPDANVTITSDYEGIKIYLTGPQEAVTRNGRSVLVPAYGDQQGGPAVRRLSEGWDGRWVLTNEEFVVAPELQGKGIASDIFARQAKALSALEGPYGHPAISRITAKMAGSASGFYKGYKEWVKMGYNTRKGDMARRPIDDTGGSTPYYDRLTAHASASERARLEAIGRDSLTLRDVYQTKEGRDLWAKYGGSIMGDFDLSPGSESLRILRGYITARHEAGRGPSWEQL